MIEILRTPRIGHPICPSRLLEELQYLIIALLAIESPPFYELGQDR